MRREINRAAAAARIPGPPQPPFAFVRSANAAVAGLCMPGKQISIGASPKKSWVAVGPGGDVSADNAYGPALGLLNGSQ